MLTSPDYLRLLKQWSVSALKYIYTPADRPDLDCYGTGYDNWGVQTHQKAFAAFAVLSSDPDTDKNKTGMSSGELRERSLRMLRFSLESHVEGNYACLDGIKWGHSWISTLGLERMMHGIDAVKEHLSDSDRRLLRNVMASESNWLLDYYYRSRPEEKGRVQAGTVENNDPEGNIWCGAHLLRTAMMYPDEPRVNEYREKGIRFLVNGISLSSDAHSQEIVSGKPVSEWHIGANFFDSFALNHHRYLNIGYMVICLSNLAMLYFSYRLKGLPVPEFIYRHVESLWNLVKLCTFPDGRLYRIGGDTRIRYCYCQDYVIPVWLMISDLCGDKDCGKFEQGWLDIIRKEMDINGDGSFLSARCNGLAAVSPLYYTRLESDRAATLSMGAYWRRVLKISSASKKGNAGILKQFWYDEYHGACLQRGKNRISSFCWKAAQPPQGLCLPADRSDLAEWKCNCAGTVIGLGRVNYQKLINHKEYLFEGGFITAGQTEICSEDFIGEGQKPETVGKHTVIFASLPDDATVLLMQRCVSPGNRVYLKEIKGLLYNVPNDIFNDNVRSYYSEKGCYKSEGCRGKEETVDINSGWLNIDNCLGIIGAYGARQFSIYRPGRRQAGLSLSQYESRVIETGLWVDEICCPYQKGVLSVNPNTILLDGGFVVLAGVTAETTAACAKTGVLVPPVTTPHDVRVLLVRGADKQWYFQVANFHQERVSFTVRLKDCIQAESLTGESKPVIKSEGIGLAMDAGEADIFKVEFS